MKMTPEMKAAAKVFASWGGKARKESLTKARRIEIARLGGKARWKGKKTA